VEAVTYVLEAEGSYELPEVEIAWWDLETQRLRRSAVPAVRFHVRANPAYVTDFEIPPDPDSLPPDVTAGSPTISPRALVLGTPTALILAGLLWVLRRSGPGWWGRYLRWRRKEREKEVAHFRRFRSACRRNDPAEAMNGFLAWLDKTGGGEGTATVGAFVTGTDDPELIEAVRDLERQLFRPGLAPGDAWRGSQLLRAVARHRRRTRPPSPSGNRPGSLAPLNPEGG
jgi:hypothetical protein